MKNWLRFITISVLFIGVVFGSIYIAPQAPDARMNVMIVGSGVEAGGSVCLYDICESFESGDGSFDETGWTEDDTAAVIDTSDSGFSECGSSSMAITYDSDTSSTSRAYYDLGASDTDFYFQVSLQTPNITDWDTIQYYINISNITTASSLRFNIRLTRGGYQPRLQVWSGSGWESEYFQLATSTEYSIGVHVAQNAASGIKVWDSAGSPIETSNGGGDYELNLTAPDYAFRYIHFEDTYTDATATIGYIDAVEVDLDATDYLGATSCDGM